MKHWIKKDAGNFIKPYWDSSLAYKMTKHRAKSKEGSLERTPEYYDRNKCASVKNVSRNQGRSAMVTTVTSGRDLSARRNIGSALQTKSRNMPIVMHAKTAQTSE